ncbi:MAG TPA: high-affinity branched-chain amino acid ABC transporter ATP-binding protein LivG, partial [Clostridiaceae bacterium]|nr:high-affinity branched-chain amino acid ABC transporter ATP-binding protein LivG [Clostridiaceae bacterium]
MSLLELNHITLKFGGLVAVSDFNLSLKENEIVGLIGPNGAGKTTCFNIITGVYKPTYGTVIYKGRNITGLRQDKITKLGIARTFQNIRLFNELTVLENVLIANHLHIRSNFLSATLRLPHYIK